MIRKNRKKRKEKIKSNIYCIEMGNESMLQFGKWVSKHNILIMIIAVLLLIPSVFGYLKTKINYDVLSYLPSSLETVEGQDIMVDEFGNGAFSVIVVEDMEMQDVATLKEQITEIEHVTDVLWYDSFLDVDVPIELLPNNIKEALFNDNGATMMIAFFDHTTSADETMEAIEQMRKTVGKQCYISGMSGIVTDIKNIFLAEMPIYVVIAALMSLLVLLLAMDSFVVPILFLLDIGIAIVYNLGSNLFLGQISYITQALVAILQLGVTMDYSIFLLNTYEDKKELYNNDKQRAMAHAISNTFKSVAGSSVTTIAGFAALCFMTFSLGMDLGIVMMKGVVIGVICCITLLPAMILTFDGAIEKTAHRSLLPNFDRISDFITKHYKLWLVIFAIMLLPAIHGNNNYEIYYNLDSSLPKTLDSSIANKKLEEEFNMNNIQIILLKNGLSASEKQEMLQEIKEVDGVTWALGYNSLLGAALPEELLPDDALSMLKTGQYEMMFVCSDYKTATDEVNAEIAKVQEIVKGFSEESMVIGEAPLTKDLADVTNVDLMNVNTASIISIFVIILFVFKSISLPIVLVAVIEFAICVNMAVPFYSGETLPFVAGIVIGTIQLGATVDYAILMTSRYQKERGLGKDKMEAISIAHKTSMKSILVSGTSLFAATFGVGLYSNIDMISAICVLLSRGAVISTIVVIFILPAFFMILDPIIVRTSGGFLPKAEKQRKFSTKTIHN